MCNVSFSRILKARIVQHQLIVAAAKTYYLSLCFKSYYSELFGSVAVFVFFGTTSLVFLLLKTTLVSLSGLVNWWVWLFFYFDWMIQFCIIDL